jgi:hypothetical protein
MGLRRNSVVFAANINSLRILIELLHEVICRLGRFDLVFDQDFLGGAQGLAVIGEVGALIARKGVTLDGRSTEEARRVALNRR